MNLSTVFIVIGTLAGFAYWGMGIAASSSFKDKRLSGSDRAFSSVMLWSLAAGRYEAQGRKLCVWGNISLVIAIASWVSWANVR